MSSAKFSSSIDVEDDAGDVLLIAPDNVNSLPLDTEMTCEKIHTLLNKKALQIINPSKNHTADCWKRFGFPIAVDQNGNVMKKYHNFVSCRSCFITYSFKSNSTSQMNRHKCDNLSSLTSSTNSQKNSQSLKQSKIASYSSNSPQHVKLKECEKNKIKKLPVINDNGLRYLIQECISLGT
jgi:hypothetical protein